MCVSILCTTLVQYCVLQLITVEINVQFSVCAGDLSCKPPAAEMQAWAFVSAAALLPPSHILAPPAHRATDRAAATSSMLRALSCSAARSGALVACEPPEVSGLPSDEGQNVDARSTTDDTDAVEEAQLFRKKKGSYKPYKPNDNRDKLLFDVTLPLPPSAR